MADLSDVTAYLLTAATSAVYPNGTSGGANSSIASIDVRLYEGWPIPEQLDLDIAGKVAGDPPTARTNGPLANVSVFPMGGAVAVPYQILNNAFVITPPSYGMSVSVSGEVVTVTGTPKAGEFLTLIADGQYAYSATGVSAAAILSALATQAEANYSGVSSTGTTITIPVARTLVARLGGLGTLGNVTHRQKQAIMISVWAPNNTVRKTLAAAIDAAIKAQLVVDLADTTQALITYGGTRQDDAAQNQGIYRRDLIFNVEYATVQQFQGIEITTVSNTLEALDTTDVPVLPSNTAVT